MARYERQERQERQIGAAHGAPAVQEAAACSPQLLVQAPSNGASHGDEAMSAVDRVVAAVADLDPGRVPEAVQTAAGLVVADCVAIGWAGASTAEATALVRATVAAAPACEAHRARVWGAQPLYANAASAAFLNGVAGTFPALDAMARDKEGRGGVGHPAMEIVPAALAAAEASHATGGQLLRAVLAGYEVSARLHGLLHVEPPAHPNGHLGAVGAAVAVALVQGADPLACARVAATMPMLSIRDACFEGATARGAWFGHAARAGIEAARMVRAGFTGSSRSLETAYGRIAGRLGNPEEAAAPLDYANLAVSRTMFKRHAACYGTHTVLDALAGVSLPEPSRVRRIVVEVPQPQHMKLNLDLPLADNLLAGQFSLPYAVATAILTGATDFEAFRWRPQAAALARQAEVTQARDLEPWGARVVIEWDGGRVIGESRHRPLPLPPEGVRERFRREIGQPADLWWSRLTRLRMLGDCARLFDTESAVP